MKKECVVQTDLFGRPLLDTKVYRMTKCGRCGGSVKLSQAKIHLSFGKALTICNECLKKEGKVLKEKF